MMASTLKSFGRCPTPRGCESSRCWSGRNCPSTNCRKSPAWGNRAFLRIWGCCRMPGCCNRAARASGRFTNCSRRRMERRWSSFNWRFAARGNCPSTRADQINLKRILHRRDEQAQVYFNQVAGRFDRSYGPGRSWQAFGHLLLRILPPLVVADLGVGRRDC